SFAAGQGATTTRVSKALRRGGATQPSREGGRRLLANQLVLSTRLAGSDCPSLDERARGARPKVACAAAASARCPIVQGSSGFANESPARIRRSTRACRPQLLAHIKTGSR